MKNRLIGGSLLIAGTTIGAGMLAMPLVCASIGFPMSVLLLITLWSLTTYSALLILEISQYHAPGCGLVTLAACYLGKPGYWLIHSTLLLLLYSLIAAYLTAGGEQLADILGSWLLPVMPKQGILLLTLLTALVVGCGPKLIDAGNRLLFSLKMVAFLVMLLLIMPHTQIRQLVALPQQSAAWLTAIPILLTAFGFHASLPSILHYLPKPFHKQRQMILLGSTIPLSVYLLWQWAIQGLMPPQILSNFLQGNSGILGLLQAIKQFGIPTYIARVVTLFAALALLTSLLGVALGLFDHCLEHTSGASTLRHRFKAILYTFLPPLLFASIYPQGFMRALGYAAIALAILALLLPVALVWKVRKQFPHGVYRANGGTLALIITLCSGLMIIVIQSAIRAGYWH
ncbi:MAG: aromatic amino acid transport family protein [Candidatus Symbiodolus clandestinus]